MPPPKQMQPCPGCHGLFEPIDGPTHRYMTSSPGCWQTFGRLLAREYSIPELFLTHRLTVDTYAVQHPGTDTRQAIQSVGLHLARLMIQLASPKPPSETNDVMLSLGKYKATLPRLEAPISYDLTVRDIPLSGTTEEHASAVRAWAHATWLNWSAQHTFIREWVESTCQERGRSPFVR